MEATELLPVDRVEPKTSWDVTIFQYEDGSFSATMHKQGASLHCGISQGGLESILDFLRERIEAESSR